MNIIFRAVVVVGLFVGSASAEMYLKRPEHVHGPMMVTMVGPKLSEKDEPNPFRDVRMNVTFERGERRITVPGYWAADGNPDKTGEDEGTFWRAHFVPDEPGEWTYHLSFRRGKDIALSDDPNAGEPLEDDGFVGKVNVPALGPNGVVRGMLREKALAPLPADMSA